MHRGTSTLGNRAVAHEKTPFFPSSHAAPVSASGTGGPSKPSPAGAKGSVRTPSRWLLLTAAVLINGAWGLSYPLSKLVLTELSPYALACWRFAGAALLLIPLVGRKEVPSRLSLRDLGLLLAMGFCFGAANIFQYWGTELTLSANVGLICSLQSALMCLLAALFLGERLGLRQMMGMGSALWGVLMLSAEATTLDFTSVRYLKGNLLVLIANLAYAMYAIIGKRLSPRWGTAARTALPFLIAALVFLPLYAGLDPSGFSRGLHLRGKEIALVIYIVAVATGLCYYGWSWLLRWLPASALSGPIYLQPLSGAFFAHLCLGETLSSSFHFGALLIGGAMVLCRQLPAPGTDDSRAQRGGEPPLKSPSDGICSSVKGLMRPTFATIDLSALVHNIRQVRRICPKTEILAVVKADAYGHGALAVARTLERAAAVKLFGVSLVEEGVELRRAGIRGEILVLGGAYSDFSEIVAHDLVPLIFSREHLWGLQSAAARAKRRVRAHLKINTGMGRLGLDPSEVSLVFAPHERTPHVVIDGLLSHLANAESDDPSSITEQIRRFDEVRTRFATLGAWQPRWFHISNSAALVDYEAVKDGSRFNLVRAGLFLYGAYPADRLPPFCAPHPVLSWRTSIVHLRRIAAGTPISYGGQWIAPRESLIAVLPIGYADGLRRELSKGGSVLIRGQRAPIVGAICMDLCMVDVTAIANVGLHDEVVLLGRQGAEEITAGQLAALLGTIPYEVLTSISARVPRIYRETEHTPPPGLKRPSGATGEPLRICAAGARRRKG